MLNLDGNDKLLCVSKAKGRSDTLIRIQGLFILLVILWLVIERLDSLSFNSPTNQDLNTSSDIKDFALNAGH